MHFWLVGVPVLSQKLIVKHYITLGSPKPNQQLSFGILTQLAISEHNGYAVGRGRMVFHKVLQKWARIFFWFPRQQSWNFTELLPARAPRVLRKQILALLLFFGSRNLVLPDFFQSKIGTRRKFLSSRTGRMPVERRQLIKTRLFWNKGEVYIFLLFCCCC